MISLQLLVASAFIATVTGIQFTMSSHQLDPTNPPQAIFWMNCTAAFLTDVNTLLYIKIEHQLSSSTVPWEVIAYVTSTGSAMSTDLSSYWRAARVSGDIYPVSGVDHPVTDSHLSVEVDASSLTSSDAGTYRCEIKYLTSPSLEDITETQNSSLTISATDSLFTMSSNQVDPTNPLQAIFWMNCTAAFLTDVNTLLVIRIERESSSGSHAPWEVIADVTVTGAVISSHLPSYWQAAQVSGSLYPASSGDHNVTDSYLSVGVDASSLTSSDARIYRCELNYLTSSSLQVESKAQNSSLAITASTTRHYTTTTQGTTRSDAASTTRHYTTTTQGTSLSNAASTTRHYATTTQGTHRPDAVFDIYCDDISAGCNVQFDICHTPAYIDWTKTNCRKFCGYCYSNAAPIVG